MSDIIPTAEEAAVIAQDLRDFFGTEDEGEIVDTVLPLLEAIAAGRVFEVRPECCAMCGGDGGDYFISDEHGNVDSEWEDCPRCDGSGYEPAPPGRKQRTAYDAMIEAAAEAGTLDDF